MDFSKFVSLDYYGELFWFYGGLVKFLFVFVRERCGNVEKLVMFKFIKSLSKKLKKINDVCLVMYTFVRE